jgi:valyl-tRNA synthetase
LEVNRNFKNWRYDLAGEDIYQFIWHRFADEYIEYSKDRMQKGDRVVLSVLRHVFLNSIKLLHPFMPFITEELWSRFPRKDEVPLIASRWPLS